MSAAAATKEEATTVDYDELEPPAENWIDLVEAFRTRDPAKVNVVLARAKKSQWSQQLWAQEIAAAMEMDESTDEE